MCRLQISSARLLAVATSQDHITPVLVFVQWYVLENKWWLYGSH